MKIQQHFITGLLALASMSLVPRPAEALTFQSGDLFLGFRATGATSDYLIDLGPASNFTTSTGAFTLNLGGNIGADLTAVFGPGWNTRNDVFWGFVGETFGSDGTNTLYASRAESTIGTQATAWDRKSNSTQAGTVSKVQALEGAYATSSANGALLAAATIQATTAPNSWNYYTKDANDFSAWTLEGNFGNGTAGSALDLFRIAPTNLAGAPDPYQGTFSITSDATGANASLNFSPSPVPEPSTYAALGLGAALLAIAARRKRQTITA